MTLDEFPAHECTTINSIPIIEVKEISIEHFYDTKSPEGNLIVMAKGLDGTFYRMVCRNREFIPISVSDDGYHESQNRRKVTRTLI
jgi:hypothetical protein